MEKPPAKYNPPPLQDYKPVPSKLCRQTHTLQQHHWVDIYPSPNIGRQELEFMVVEEKVTEICATCGFAQTFAGKVTNQPSTEDLTVYFARGRRRVPPKIRKYLAHHEKGVIKPEPLGIIKGKMQAGWTRPLFTKKDGEDTKNDFPPEYIIKTVMEELDKIDGEHTRAHLIARLIEDTPAEKGLDINVVEMDQFIGLAMNTKRVVDTPAQRYLVAYWEVCVSAEGKSFMAKESNIHNWLAEWLGENPANLYPVNLIEVPAKDWPMTLEGRGFPKPEEKEEKSKSNATYARRRAVRERYFGKDPPEEPKEENPAPPEDDETRHRTRACELAGVPREAVATLIRADQNGDAMFLPAIAWIEGAKYELRSITLDESGYKVAIINATEVALVASVVIRQKRAYIVIGPARRTK